VPALAAVQAVMAALAMVDGLVPVRAQSLRYPDSFEAMMPKPWGARNLPSLLVFFRDAQPLGLPVTQSRGVAQQRRPMRLYQQVTDRAPACAVPNEDLRATD
jgi:hypothetical protein